jgi:sulfatase maturation enzyme AslB (radical SAM superfamily)
MSTAFFIYKRKIKMTTTEIKQIEKCNLACEYYLFSLHTFGETSAFTRKFKKEFFQILKNIGEINPDYIHSNSEESIVIDYNKFELDIDVIMRKSINEMTGIELNVLLHRIAGGTIYLCSFYDCWTSCNRAIFLRDYGDVYMTTRRGLLIGDILSDDILL